MDTDFTSRRIFLTHQQGAADRRTSFRIEDEPVIFNEVFIPNQRPNWNVVKDQQGFSQWSSRIDSFNNDNRQLEPFLSNQSTAMELIMPNYKLKNSLWYEQSGLASTNWTQSETDYLIQLCRQFNGRLFIVQDRYSYLTNESPPHNCNIDSTNKSNFPKRTLEDIRSRVARILGMSYDIEMDRVSRDLIEKETSCQRQIQMQLLEDTITALPSIIPYRHKALLLIGGNALANQLLFHNPTLPELVGGSIGKAITGYLVNLSTNNNLNRSSNSIGSLSNETDTAPKSSKKKKVASVKSEKVSNGQISTDPKHVDKVPGSKKSSNRGSSNTYARSVLTVVSKTTGGATRQIDRILLEMGLPKPVYPTRKVCEKYEELRQYVVQLIDAQKSAENATNSMQNKINTIAFPSSIPSESVSDGHNSSRKSSRSSSPKPMNPKNSRLR